MAVGDTANRGDDASDDGVGSACDPTVAGDGDVALGCMADVRGDVARRKRLHRRRDLQEPTLR